MHPCSQDLVLHILPVRNGPILADNDNDIIIISILAYYVANGVGGGGGGVLGVLVGLDLAVDLLQLLLGLRAIKLLIGRIPVLLAGDRVDSGVGSDTRAVASYASGV